VLLLIGAQARPEAYPDPDRSTSPAHHTDHLAFSSGIHYCLGNPWPDWKQPSPYKHSPNGCPTCTRRPTRRRSSTPSAEPIHLPVRP